MVLYAVVLGIIVVTLLGVSLARLGSVKTKADYLVAGRSLPAFVLVFTLLSSWIGSGSLLGGAENAYKHGFAALWQGRWRLGRPAADLFHRSTRTQVRQFTIPDLLESRYNQTARVLGVIAVLFTYTAITSYQFIGGGDIVHLIFPQRHGGGGPIHPGCLCDCVHLHRRDGLRGLYGRGDRFAGHRHHDRGAAGADSPGRRLGCGVRAVTAAQLTSRCWGDLSGDARRCRAVLCPPVC